MSGFDYAPFSNSRGSDSGNGDLAARRQAQLFLIEAEQSDPGSAAYHALALLYSTEWKFDSAIQQFERSLAADDSNAQVHSDLGAILVEKAKVDQVNGVEGLSFEGFAKSLEHFNRALEIDDSLLEALFNRALCRQYLSLRHAATDDWKNYLEKDATSPWADEVRRNLQQLESHKHEGFTNRQQSLDAFISAFESGDEKTAWQQLSLNRNATGGLVENDLLDRWLTQDANGQSADAKKTLQSLTYAGELNVQRANDHFFANLIKFYKSLSPAKRPLLREAHNLMSEGHQNLLTLKPEKAIEHYNRAAVIFERLGDREELIYLEYPLAHSYLLVHEPERALRVFHSVARDAEANQYKWLLSQSLAGIGNVQIGLSDYSESLKNSNRARDVSEQIGDVRGQLKLADQLSITYTRLGNYHQAIASQRRVLNLLGDHPVDAFEAWRTHFLIAAPLQLMGRNAAAEDFQRESLRIATSSKILYSICRSHIGLGLIFGSRGNFEEAQKHARMAFDLAKDISSEASRSDTIGYSSLLLGDLYRHAKEFDKAIEGYDQVLKAFEGAKYPAFLYAAHKGKLLSCMAQGGCPSIQAEIAQTLSLFENHRAKIREEENKFIFFDVEQNVYDAVIGYEFAQDPNSEVPLDLSERSRARSLLDLTTRQAELVQNNSDSLNTVASVSHTSMTATELRQRMPESSQLLQYAVLEDRVLIWLISTSGVKSFESRVAARELREKVSRYLQLLLSPARENEEEIQNLSTGFHDLLIKPVEAALDQNKELCIVPDKHLNHLPYAALISRSSRKYLTEEFVLTRAPSATLFILSSEKARSKDTSVTERALSVGNPHFDRRAFPELADLPDSKREAEAIAAFYKSTPITGDKALVRRVVTEMEKADVIHFAMHAVVNEHSPLRSRLLFSVDIATANNSYESGTLAVAELTNIPSPHTRLVVLSACQTALGRYYDGEGMVGIARPFLVQGVPLVVASLWPVDSSATAELMISFHKKRVKEQLSSAQALASAQREMLSSNNGRRHPYYWASFVLIGGYASF